MGKVLAPSSGPGGRTGFNFDGRLSRSDPGGAVGVRTSGFRSLPDVPDDGRDPNRFHASGECRGKEDRYDSVHSHQIQQPPIFLSRPLASTMPGHVATLFLPA